MFVDVTAYAHHPLDTVASQSRLARLTGLSRTSTTVQTVLIVSHLNRSVPISKNRIARSTSLKQVRSIKTRPKLYTHLHTSLHGWPDRLVLSRPCDPEAPPAPAAQQEAP